MNVCVKSMSNRFQEIRMRNIENVKRLIARSMPSGADDEKLRATLSKKFAVSKTEEYLAILRACGEIDLVDGRWILVLEK